METVAISDANLVVYAGLLYPDGCVEVYPQGVYAKIRKVSVFLPVIQALNERGVDYVLVGGLATVLHGYPRLTADIKLVIRPR